MRGSCAPPPLLPDFDLDQAITSLRKFRARRPAGVALAHYGLMPDPLEALEEGGGDPASLGRGGGEGLSGGGRHHRCPRSGILTPPRRMSTPEHRTKLETLNGIHSNAAGLRRWLETTKADPTA